MPLIETTIEFFIYQGASSLVVTALLMLIYVIYRISKLNSLNEYKAVKYAVIWSIIAIPQIIGLLAAQEYKEYLPIHAIELTEESCKRYLKENLIKDQKCELYGRVLEDQSRVYLFQLHEEMIRVKKCDVLRIRKRNFTEYKIEFRDFYQKTPIFNVIFDES